jgi:hypothetical protein
MSVIREAGGVEDRAPVEDGKDLLLCARHLPVPELEVPAVLFLPVLVQVDEDINAPVELESVVAIEVRMHLKPAPRIDLVQTASDVVWVGDDALYSGDCLEKLQHGPAVEKVKDVTVGLRQLFDHIEGELSFLLRVELLPGQLPRRGELSQGRFRRLRGQEVVDVYVREWPVVLVLAGLLFPENIELIEESLTQEFFHGAPISIEV